MTNISISNSTSFAPMQGRCYCGLVTLTLKASPIFVNCCHCRSCQQLTGSAFGLNIMIEASNVEITSSTQPIITSHDDNVPADGNITKREGAGTRCPNSRCSTLLWGTHPRFSNKIIFLRAGVLEESEKIGPDAHFFTRSKHPWVTIPKGVRAYDTFPGKDDPTLWSKDGAERVEAALRAD